MAVSSCYASRALSVSRVESCLKNRFRNPNAVALMSSNEENSGEEDAYRSGFQPWDGDDGLEGRYSKKRKGRACDTCRRRKSE
jgi:hypothetical protein